MLRTPLDPPSLFRWAPLGVTPLPKCSTPPNVPPRNSQGSLGKLLSMGDPGVSGRESHAQKVARRRSKHPRTTFFAENPPGARGTPGYPRVPQGSLGIAGPIPNKIKAGIEIDKIQ